MTHTAGAFSGRRGRPLPLANVPVALCVLYTAIFLTYRIMKIKNAILAAVFATMLASCSDLGFGVDVGSGGVSPYLYGNSGPFYGGYSGGPYFGLDFPYGYLGDYTPSAPPIVGNGPGSVFNPTPKPAPRPPQNPPVWGAGNPGIAIPSGGGASIPGAGAGVRPGNGGLPTGTPVTSNPSSVPVGQPLRGR